MKAEWMTVEITEHTRSGTTHHRAIFPCSNVTHIQHESLSSVLAQMMETWFSVQMGLTLEMEVSYAELLTIELTEDQHRLINKFKGKKGANRWERFFVAANGNTEVPNGKGS